MRLTELKTRRLFVLMAAGLTRWWTFLIMVKSFIMRRTVVRAVVLSILVWWKFYAWWLSVGWAVSAVVVNVSVRLRVLARMRLVLARRVSELARVVLRSLVVSTVSASVSVTLTC